MSSSNTTYHIFYWNCLSVGVISTADHLDRESKDLYILNIYALNKGAPLSMSSPLQVVVTVSDENDNSPSFEKHKYKVRT